MKGKIALLAIIVISFASCEKEDYDYRNKFVGKYKCTIDTEGGTVSGGYFFDINTNWQDTVIVSKTKDSSIIIAIGDYKHQTEVSEDGRFDDYSCEGMFVGNRIYYTSYSSSPGGYYKTIYYGIKFR